MNLLKTTARRTNDNNKSTATAASKMMMNKSMRSSPRPLLPTAMVWFACLLLLLVVSAQPVNLLAAFQVASAAASSSSTSSSVDVYAFYFVAPRDRDITIPGTDYPANGFTPLPSNNSHDGGGGDNTTTNSSDFAAVARLSPLHTMERALLGLVNSSNITLNQPANDTNRILSACLVIDNDRCLIFTNRSGALVPPLVWKENQHYDNDNDTKREEHRAAHKGFIAVMDKYNGYTNVSCPPNVTLDNGTVVSPSPFTDCIAFYATIVVADEYEVDNIGTPQGAGNNNNQDNDHNYHNDPENYFFPSIYLSDVPQMLLDLMRAFVRTFIQGGGGDSHNDDGPGGNNTVTTHVSSSWASSSSSSVNTNSPSSSSSVSALPYTIGPEMASVANVSLLLGQLGALQMSLVAIEIQAVQPAPSFPVMVVSIIAAATLVLIVGLVVAYCCVKRRWWSAIRSSGGNGNGEGGDDKQDRLHLQHRRKHKNSFGRGKGGNRTRYFERDEDSYAVMVNESSGGGIAGSPVSSRGGVGDEPYYYDDDEEEEYEYHVKKEVTVDADGYKTTTSTAVLIATPSKKRRTPANSLTSTPSGRVLLRSASNSVSSAAHFSSELGGSGHHRSVSKLMLGADGIHRQRLNTINNNDSNSNSHLSGSITLSSPSSFPASNSNTVHHLTVHGYGGGYSSSSHPPRAAAGSLPPRPYHANTLGPCDADASSVAIIGDDATPNNRGKNKSNATTAPVPMMQQQRHDDDYGYGEEEPPYQGEEDDAYPFTPSDSQRALLESDSIDFSVPKAAELRQNQKRRLSDSIAAATATASTTRGGPSPPPPQQQQQHLRGGAAVADINNSSSATSAVMCGSQGHFKDAFYSPEKRTAQQQQTTAAALVKKPIAVRASSNESTAAATCDLRAAEGSSSAQLAEHTTASDAALFSSSSAAALNYRKNTHPFISMASPSSAAALDVDEAAEGPSQPADAVDKALQFD